MKIKRFFAPDIRQAIRMVREEQGPDAVILSNSRVNGGVEIVAAVDYDETVFKAVKGEFPGEARAAETQAATVAPVRNTGAEMPVNRAAVGNPSVSRFAAPAFDANGSIWSQEPTLIELRAELSRMRLMMENQLSSLAWGQFARREPAAVELIQRLMCFGLTAAQSRRLVDGLGRLDGDVEALWQRALNALSSCIPLYGHDILNDGGIVALVGPTGVGKTTTAAKLAARYAMRHGSRQVALITIDNYRVGAYEQLRTYGRILDVPVKTADSRDGLRKVLNDLCDRRLILIDTTGMGQHDSGLQRQAELLDKAHMNKKTLLLLSATTRLSGLGDVADAFGVFRPDGCILTKLDEATCLGGAVSTAISRALPVAYYSDGQRVPEDLHPARAGALVTRGVETMKNSESHINEDLIALSFGKEVSNAYV
ncbi:MAG: flagellar biosynthesis protein FlhF [Gammaproteobacteria bacterium]|nr:flagellar biosynthesis protein FlhF [Gammaproteobacteria bacterium]